MNKGSNLQYLAKNVCNGDIGNLVDVINKFFINICVDMSALDQTGVKENIVLPVPAAPEIRTVEPLINPPSINLSKPGIPEGILSKSIAFFLGIIRIC